MEVVLAMSQTNARETVKAERRTYNLWPETGRILGLGKNATYAAAERGEIPTIKIGGRLLVPREALEQLLSGARRSA